MTKQKKKRNKQYKGSGAAQTQPTITHVSAVKRNKVHLWWLEHKRIAKPLAIGGGIGAIVIVLIVEIIRLFV